MLNVGKHLYLSAISAGENQTFFLCALGVLSGKSIYPKSALGETFQPFGVKNIPLPKKQDRED
jgi:hypothetical protein